MQLSTIQSPLFPACHRVQVGTKSCFWNLPMPMSSMRLSRSEVWAKSSSGESDRMGGVGLAIWTGIDWCGWPAREALAGESGMGERGRRERERERMKGKARATGKRRKKRKSGSRKERESRRSESEREKERVEACASLLFLLFLPMMDSTACCMHALSCRPPSSSSFFPSPPPPLTKGDVPPWTQTGTLSSSSPTTLTATASRIHSAQTCHLLPASFFFRP